LHLREGRSAQRGVARKRKVVTEKMIIQCQGCAAKYFLPEDRVPPEPLKVKCPKCQAVFTLIPRQEPVHAAAAAPAAAAPTAHPAASPASDAIPRLETAPRYEAPDRKRAKQRKAEAPAPASKPPKAEAAAPATKPDKARAKASGSKRRKGRSPEDRAKRLARVLVSDILWYNREKRDQALEDGTLMTALGEEIKKSWELYKEKVGAEVANSTNHFKEALNEILADGQQVF
jgi:predicted Zn finger-like uncharacterized protein